MFGVTMAEMFSGIPESKSELSTDQVALLEVYDKLSPKNKQVVLTLIKGLSDKET